MGTARELALELINHNAIEKVMEVLEATNDFILQRKETIGRMREEADKLDKHKFLGNITQIVGGGTAVGAVIVGAVLAPFSYGASLGVGVGVGVASELVSKGSQGSIYLLARGIKQTVDDIIDADEKKFAKLLEKWNELDRICKSVGRMQQK